MECSNKLDSELAERLERAKSKWCRVLMGGKMSFFVPRGVGKGARGGGHISVLILCAGSIGFADSGDC